MKWADNAFDNTGFNMVKVCSCDAWIFVNQFRDDIEIDCIFILIHVSDDDNNI